MFSLFTRSIVRTRSISSRSFVRLLSNAAQQQPRIFSSRRRLALLTFGTLTAFAGVLHTRPIAHLDAKKDEDSEDAEGVQLDPDTNIAFPTTLVIPSKVRLPPYSLLGLGVRKVSFLGIKVYSVGFYADLSSPNLKIPTDYTPEQKLDYIVSNTSCVIRIIPTRSTSYTHLRDAFIRSLQAKLSASIKDGSLSVDDAEDVQSPLRKLKSLFPNTSFAKGTPLDIILTAPPKDRKDKRVLVVRDLGSIENDWIAKNLIMSYFEGNGISPPMKRMVFEKLENSMLIN